MTTTLETVRVVKADQGTRQTAQTPGMDRQEMLTTPGAWVGVARTQPGVTSGWHHHGDYETIIYVQVGRILMEFGPDGQDACMGDAGDFVYVPRGAMHRESNPGDVEQQVVLVRVGSGIPVFNVDGPGC